MALKPIKDSILFKFVQTTRDGFFRKETDWGFKIAGDDIDASKARWGLVEVVGPDVKAVSKGDYILIEPLKWTTAHHHDGEQYWRTAEPHVMATTDIRPSDII